MKIEIATIISFATGLGVGTIITAYVQYYLNRRAKLTDNLLEERKSAFDKFLVSYADLAAGWTIEKSMNFALCEARIQLVGSRLTITSLKALKETESGTHQRDEAHASLIESMRSDIGLA